LIILATSILDLRASTPDWVDARAATCTSQLIHFDPIGGLLQFNTTSAYSINTWIQTIMFDNWQDLVQFDRGELGLPPPPAPVEEPEIPEPDIELEPEPQELSPAPGPPAQQKKPWGDLYPWYTGARLRLAQAVEALPADILPDEPGELLVKSTEQWPTVYAAYPDLINSDVKVHCNCLTEDTKIPLLDGKTVSMKELYTTYGSDKHFWVYSTDKNGEFVPGKAKSLGITNYVKELYYVTLDNGSTVKCTGNHRFMLRTGEYVYAKDLTPGTSLMPLYLRDKKIYSTSSSGDYLQYKSNTGPGWRFVFRKVAECALPDEKNNSLKMEDTVVVHHKNFDKHNNTPENLEWKGYNEHLLYHSTVAKNNKNLKNLWDNRRNEMLGHVQRAGVSSYKKNQQNIINGRALGIAWTKSIDGRKQISNRKTAFWSNINKCGRRKILEKSINAITNRSVREINRKRMIAFHARTSEKYRENLSKRMKEYNKKNCVRNKSNVIKRHQQIGKIMKSCYIIETIHGVKLSPGTYERYKLPGAAHYNKFFSSFDRVQYWWGRNKEAILDNYKPLLPTDMHKCSLEVKSYINRVQENEYKNHKVKSVQVVKFDEPVPVYDLSVDQYENFLLEQGIIVHNCPAYLWHGSQYELETRDTELIPEGVPAPREYPEGRAPKALSNIICKHLAAVFNQHF